LSSAHTHYYEAHTVIAGDVTNGYIDLTVTTYTTADNSLQLWLKRSGEPPILLVITEDYTETSTSRITFTAGLMTSGDTIIARWRK
jgi:hypothetical protein